MVNLKNKILGAIQANYNMDASFQFIKKNRKKTMSNFQSLNQLKFNRHPILCKNIREKL